MQNNLLQQKYINIICFSLIVAQNEQAGKDDDTPDELADKFVSLWRHRMKADISHKITVGIVEPVLSMAGQWAASKAAGYVKDKCREMKDARDWDKWEELNMKKEELLELARKEEGYTTDQVRKTHFFAQCLATSMQTKGFFSVKLTYVYIDRNFSDIHTPRSLSIAFKDSPAARVVKAEYEREVTKLMQGCRSQKLYAEIVREGGAALGVHSMQAIANITGRPIVVQTVDGTESPFPDVVPSEGGKVSIHF